MKTILLSLSILLLFLQNGKAQITADTSSRNVIITTIDDNVLSGKVIAEDMHSITLQVANRDSLKISKKSIVMIEEIRSQTPLDDKYRKKDHFHNLNATQYLFTPTGFGLKKGEAYYKNTYITVNSINYGVTDHFSISGTTEIYSLFTGNIGMLINPKFSINLADNWNMGLGSLFGIAINYHDESSFIALPYGVVTYGNRRNNANLGLSTGITFDGYISPPFLTFGGMAKISNRWALLTENWLITDFEDGFAGLNSIGGRYFGTSISVDFALITNGPIFSDFIIPFIPWVSLTIPFGRSYLVRN